MSRTTVPLTPALWDALPDDVAGALPWTRLREDPRHAERDGREWIEVVLAERGTCGRALVWDDRVVGALVHAPASHLPGLAQVPAGPPADDAVVLVAVWIAPEARGGGGARMLLQATARDLVVRDVAGLEAYGASRRWRGRAARHGVVLSTRFLGAVGFTPRRRRGGVTRMRMELRGTRWWTTELQAVLARTWTALRPGGLRPGAVGAEMTPAAGPDTRSGTAAGGRSG
ncbi:GNAT family N-acetyltransferase [Nocardioides yefusunii]|uniref:GNAT family N-acetyltransferase n=1 Tax=Nocardioides yefusunii TaxID=2500546 RepID=A0ABW1R2T5_9ACTN|nr:GNAT family N-acetyltransferase [Nocardioides yefusunii]